ncbi:hypothetical protein IB257_05800 [Achromobacter sp. ACM03]|uniref:hypothetical protein n=1 Tax=Achromobacter sp. ACM03 TaxID=2769300 RepID=UPI001784A0E1|nr:hypothetical protein [Achromobacter sp. ACM03]MBD9429441.1 hypothetical protein [Achromobacter sp. ACM03]
MQHGAGKLQGLPALFFPRNLTRADAGRKLHHMRRSLTPFDLIITTIKVMVG